MKAFRLAAAALLFATQAHAQFLGTSTQEGAGASPLPPDTSMCIAPPTTFNNVWYVDPVHGHTVTGGGNGSSGSPWNSLNALTNSVAGYPGPLLTTASGGVGPVAPGDEVLLMTGSPTDYGAVTIGTNGFQINNSAYVTIAAAPGQTPNLYSLSIFNATKFNVVGLTVSGVSSPASSKNQLITVNTQGGIITHDIQLNNITAYSVDDTTRNGWSQADWATFGRGGILSQGTVENTVYCVRVSHSEVKNTIGAAMSVFSDNTIIDNNEFHDWATDALDFGANNLIIENNYIHDAYQLSDGAHVDGMQGFISRPLYHDILIDSNVVNYATGRHNFDTVTAVVNGGIDETDQDWTRVVVTNNVSIFPNHAISFSDCHDCLIAGNTALPARLFQDSDQHGGDISFFAQSKTFSVSSNVVIKNNLSGVLAVSDPNAIVKNNVMSTSSVTGGNNFISALGFFSAPGTYGSGNVVDSGGIATEVTAFDDSTTFTFDLHLLSSAPARGAGATTMPMPVADIAGVLRAPTHDAGAYVHP